MEKLSNILKSEEKTFSFEVYPTKTQEGYIKLLNTLKELAKLEPTFMSCTYGAGGGNREKTLDIVEYIVKELNTIAMAHLTCIAHTKDEIKSILADIYKRNIRNILALRGDPPKDNPTLTPGINNFKHSSELVKCIREIYKDDFSIAVAGFPEMHPLSSTKESDLFYLKEKVNCGADFVVTQLFFDNEDYFNYVKNVRSMGIKAKIIPGILPITSYGGLVKFCNSCKAKIPEIVHKTFGPIENNQEKTIELGIEFAIKQCKELLANGAPGIHFYTLNKLHPVKDILEAIK